MPEPKFEQSLHSRAPSFRARVAVAVILLVSVTLSVAAIAMWGVIRIHEDSRIALRGYRQLREVFEVGVYVTQARQALRESTPNSIAASREAEMAAARLNLFTTSNGGWLAESEPVQNGLRRDLALAASTNDDEIRGESLDGSLARLATLAAQVRTSVEAHESAAARERSTTLVLIGLSSAGFLLLATVIGFLHYRSVVKPIDELSRAVRGFASGRLDQRVGAWGDREFAQFARDLNHMADELQSLYNDLEQKVEQKSRELVRSERLASVGYLAAGVAHEINNPLGIIAAYAERALQKLRRGAMDAESSENAQRAFQIICDEAFRCKEITDRLLNMARSGSDGRKPASIAALAQEVVAMLATLPQFKQVHLTLKCDEDRNSLVAELNEVEIKQVLLNLLVNAAEAIDGGGGAVNVAVSSRDATVQIAVADNGRGMDVETLHRIFEPFFSQKKSQRHGTGLGLSICHAIVESHGGQLTAASEGAGKGSHFVMTLPAFHEAKEADA